MSQIPGLMWDQGRVHIQQPTPVFLDQIVIEIEPSPLPFEEKMIGHLQEVSALARHPGRYEILSETWALIS